MSGGAQKDVPEPFPPATAIQGWETEITGSRLCLKNGRSRIFGSAGTEKVALSREKNLLKLVHPLVGSPARARALSIPRLCLSGCRPGLVPLSPHPSWSI